MSLSLQQPLPGIDLPRREPSAGQLLQIALEKESGIEIIERITAMMERERDYQNNVGFDEALNRCQKAIETVLPDCEASNRVWASYRKLNSTVRPLYTAEGFSIAFTEEKAHTEGKIRIVALVSRQGITRSFAKEMTPVTTGAQGKAVMNMTDAEASIESRVKRYLIKDIFNIAVGNDADELVGLTVEQAEDLQSLVDQMKNSETLEDCRDAYRKAYAKAREAKNSDATLKVIEVFEKCQQDFARPK